jgi:TPR repeat protein
MARVIAAKDSKYGLALVRARLFASFRSYKNDAAERSFAAVVGQYRLAAAQGHYAAQFLLGSMYCSDDGVAQDFAAVLRHKLAAQGPGAWCGVAMGRQVLRAGLGFAAWGLTAD